jgi:hypothetical protein
VLNPEHMNMEFVEGFETCIADNAMQKKGRENPGKDLDKGFQGQNGFGVDISTTVAAHKSKRPKRLKVR